MRKALIKNKLSERFKLFAEKECKGSSELYEFLSLKIAEDDELLTLASQAQNGQPIPNLFLGAVHYLLLCGKNHKLKEYYPSLVEQPLRLINSFGNFRDFCNLYKDEMIDLLKSKLVQTNEVRRCAYLYPTFSYIYNNVRRPISLIEIGTSAGFQLLWDQYRYTYQTEETYGNEASTLHIQSEIKGPNIPVLNKTSPPVAHRYGLDLHINDVRNSEDSLWLKALIWPEHNERRELFEKAVESIQNNKVTLIEGDGIALLPKVVEEIPNDTILCVFHTHVANQIPSELKHKLLEVIKSIGQKRDIFHLYNNIWDEYLHLDSVINGKEENQIIGKTEGHGKWFEWGITGEREKV